MADSVNTNVSGEGETSDEQEIVTLPDRGEGEDNPSPTHTNLQRFWMLSKFMLPLVVTQIVPDIAEQVLNRGITSLASSEMVFLLAAFGLATYVCRLFAAITFEFRHISIVLVHDMHDYKKMLIFVLFISGLFCLMILLIGLTPLGDWLIRDIHQQSEEVTEYTLFITCCLIPWPLLEAVANYHEGGLIKYKFTIYAAIAKFVDVSAQIIFVMVLLFTPTRSDPILIPISALYAGTLGRFILDVGFWFVLVRRKLNKPQSDQKAVTFLGGCKFFTPLGVVRFVQVVSRPLINLVVSRQLAQTSKTLAAEAIAILTVVYPTGRALFSWLNDFRTVIPTFYKSTKQHERFPMKMLILYGLFCTLAAFTVNGVLFIAPGPAFFIMNSIVGVTPELAQKCIIPLRIFAFFSLTVGLRSICSSYVIYRKKTVYLTPSAFLRFAALLAALVILPYVGLSGAVYGITSLFISFLIEALSVILGIILMKYAEPRFLEWRRRKAEDNTELGETTPL